MTIQTDNIKRQLAAVMLAKVAYSDPGDFLPLLPWTILRRAYIDPKTPFDLPNHLYLVGIYSEAGKESIVKKAAQLGLSEWLVSYALHACDERGLDVIYVMPTAGDVSDFSQSRFGPALEASPYLDNVVVPASASDGRRGSDKVTLKRIRDSFLYFRGGQVGTDGSARQLKSVPADVLILDELDEMDPRAQEIARKRLGHSSVAEVRAISTPTYPGIGIDKLWQDSDQREWFVRCGGCGKRQHITIDHVVTAWDDLERPVAWHGQADGLAWAACEKCGKKLHRTGRGEWVPRFPARPVRGYHPTKFASPVASLLQIVSNLITTDETKRREAFNQDLGETYTPKGGQITDEILDDCRREYGHGARPGQACYMGADVGKVIHAVARRPVGNGEFEQVWAGEVDSFEELARTMKRLNVKRLVIDALPETRKCRELQASQPEGVVWLAYYGEKSKLSDPVNFDEKNGVANLDRTRSLDETFSRFYDQRSTLPANARDIRDYYDHLKASVRIIEDRPSGEKVARYIESGPDHLAHAENYCMAAMAAPVGRVVTASRVVTE